MQTTTKVNYKSTSNPYIAMQLLRSLPSVIACDFETASKYTDSDKLVMQAELDSIELKTSPRALELAQRIRSDGLSHPSMVDITHLSVAWSDSDAIVIITDTPKLRSLVYNWLTTTDRLQIWHNASFDFRLIYHNTRKFPINYEDSQILAKTILNHVEVHKANTGLKHLQGWKYGSWGLSADHFNMSQMYDEEILQYAAIDAAATFSLWQELQSYLKAHS